MRKGGGGGRGMKTQEAVKKNNLYLNRPDSSINWIVASKFLPPYDVIAISNRQVEWQNN